MQLIDEIKKAQQTIHNTRKYANNEALQAIHTTALNDFLVQGIPGIKHEEWKYVNLLGLKNADVVWSPETEIVLEQISGYFINAQHATHLVFVNGIFKPNLSQIHETHVDLLHIRDLAQVFAAHDASLVYDRFGGIDKYNKDGILAMQYALVLHGVLIEVPKKCVVQHPVYIYHLYTQNRVFATPRVLVDVQAQAQLTIAEIFPTKQHIDVFYNGATEFLIADDALVHYVRYVGESESTTHLGTVQANVNGKSAFYSTTVVTDGNVVRNNLNVCLNSPYSEAHLYGLNLLHGTTTSDHHTVVDHSVPNCVSNELYKSIVDDKASSVFNGKIFVRPDAQKTNAYQSSKSVLLSEYATSNSKPQLEIWADDVKCSHGHATGQLDKDALFYLKARGIGEREAIAMLTIAFAQDIINSVKEEALRTYLEHEVESRFSNKG